MDSGRTDEYVRKSGHLDVGQGHKLYYEDWGNPKAFPIIFLHGGPGGGFSDRHKLNFNPRKHRVIFFDQRGAGKSTPYASIEHNTTQDLVSDIEKLRKHFGIEKAHISGRSWGSTLALAYAIAHPDRVKHMLIGGVYLGSRFENDFVVPVKLPLVEMLNGFVRFMRFIKFIGFMKFIRFISLCKYS